MSTYQYHANCPHCANQINFNDAHTGHEIPCPNCGKGVVLSGGWGNVWGKLVKNPIIFFVGLFLLFAAAKLMEDSSKARHAAEQKSDAEDRARHEQVFREGSFDLEKALKAPVDRWWDLSP